MKHTPLSRKKFLSNAFKTGVILSLSSVSKSIFAFSASDSESYRKNPIAYAEAIGLTSKIQKILLTAMLAPNSHNTQPWKVKIDSENSFLLYGDADRTLKAIDPMYRQFFHSQGTFLELAKLTADSLMYNSKITFFPKGIPSSAEKFISYPVARFEIQEKSECVHDFLFLSLPNRVMNRSEYSGEFLKEDDINNLNKLTFAKFVNLKFILGEEKIKEFHSPLIASFEAEVNLREANELSRIWFRSANEDIYTKRDGITLEGNGLSGVKLWIAKKFFLDLTETGWHSESSKKASVDLARKQVESAKGLVFFITEGKDTPLEWVKTGIDFMRFTLAAANQNFAFHTMNQAVEDYKESLFFQNKLNGLLKLKKTEKIQLIGRLGRSDTFFASPRRDLSEIVL